MASRSGTPEAMRSAQCPAACCASSSMMSASRAGSTGSGPTRARTRAFQSGMANAGHTVQRGDERLPAPALRVERGLALGGQTVKAPAAYSGPLDPAALNQAAALQAIERRIQRRDVELERAVGAAVDQLGDFIAVAVALFEERQDQGLGAALTQLAVGRHMRSAYVSVIHMSMPGQPGAGARQKRGTWNR